MNKYIFSFCIMLIFSATQLSAQDAKTALNDLEKYITSKEWRIKSLEVKDDIFYFHFNEDFTSFPILEADDQVTQIDRGIKIHCKNDEKCVNWFNMYVTSYKLESDYYEPVKLASLFNKFLKAYRDEKNGISKPLPEKPIATKVYNRFDKVKVTAINMNNDWNPKKINDANEVLNKTFILLENTPPNKYGTYRCNFLGKNGKLLYLEDVNLEPSSEVSVSDIAFNTQQYPTITTTSDIYLPKGTHVLVYFMGIPSVTNISEETTKTILGKPGVLNKDILKSALYDEYASYTVDITLDGTGKQFSINSAKCIALQPIVYKKPQPTTSTNNYNSSSASFKQALSDEIKDLKVAYAKLNEESKNLKYTTVSSSPNICSFMDSLLIDYPNNFDNSYIQQYNLFATQLYDKPVLYDFGVCRFHLKDVDVDDISPNYVKDRKQYTAYMLQGNTSMEVAKKKYIEIREALLSCDLPYGNYQLEENKEETTFIIRNPTKINPGYSEKYKNMYIMVRLINRNEVPELVKNSYEKYGQSIFIYIEIL